MIADRKAFAVSFVTNVKITQHFSHRIKDRSADNGAHVDIDGQLMLDNRIVIRITGAVGHLILQYPTRNAFSQGPGMLKRDRHTLPKILTHAHATGSAQPREDTQTLSGYPIDVLAEDVLPVVESVLTDEIDAHVAGRVREMRARYPEFFARYER